MAEVIKLTTYRVMKQRNWVLKNKERFNLFVGDFIARSLDFNFWQALQSYQNLQHAHMEKSWDYTDLREHLHEWIEGPFVDFLYQELTLQWWFDPKLMTKDELLEQCLSLFILEAV